MKKLLETDAASNSSKIGPIYPILGISVDRLSVVGTAPDDQWVNDFRYMDTPMLKGLRGKLRFPLHLTDKTRAFELQLFGNLIFLEYKPNGIRGSKNTVRVDFNPNRLTGNIIAIHFLKARILEQIGMLKATRIDLAADLDINLLDYKLLTDRSRKRFVYKGHDGSMTYYIGSPRGKNFYRIYDKNLERVAKRLPPLYPQADNNYRIEYVMRKSKVDTWRTSFLDIHLFRKPNGRGYEGGWVNVNNFLELIGLWELDEAWTWLTVKKRKKLKQEQLALSHADTEALEYTQAIKDSFKASLLQIEQTFKEYGLFYLTSAAGNDNSKT